MEVCRRRVSTGAFALKHDWLRRWPARCAVMCAAVLAMAAPARGDQLASTFYPSLSEAARLMIVLGVQQGISSLPPTSGQSFTYEYNPQSDTYERGRQLGPISLRSRWTTQ